MYLSFIFRVSNQGRTKEEPRMNQRTPNHPKVLFIKIAVSVTSLIPCLVLSRELRETTEGTPKEDHMTKKALFLRLSPKRLTPFLKKLTYLFKEKITSKAFFLAYLEKKVYLCGQNCNNYDCIVTSLWQISRK